MIQNAVLILLLGLIVSNVSNSGHIGGFIGGALIAFVVSPIGFGPNRGGANRLWDVLAFGTLAVVLACLALAGWRFYEHTSEAQALEIERAVEGARATEARRIRRPIENLRHTYEREYLRAQWAQLAQSLRANADELARMASAEIEDEEVARVAREASERMRRRAEDFAAAARGEIDEPPVDDEEYERVRLLDLLVRGWIP